jgi:hypothetical protein
VWKIVYLITVRLITVRTDWTDLRMMPPPSLHRIDTGEQFTGPDERIE